MIWMDLIWIEFDFVFDSDGFDLGLICFDLDSINQIHNSIRF